MIAIIEKGTMGFQDDEPVYSIIIDEETDTEVNFMATLQIDGTLADLSEEFEFDPGLLSRLKQLPDFESVEVDLKIILDIVR